MKAEIPPLLYNKFFASPVCCWSKKHSWGQSLSWQKIGNHVASVAASGGWWRDKVCRCHPMTPHSVGGGGEGGGEVTKKQREEMENAAAFDHFWPQKSEMTKWRATFQLQNCIGGLLSSVCQWKKGRLPQIVQELKSTQVQIWTLLGGLSGWCSSSCCGLACCHVVEVDIVASGGGEQVVCGCWRSRVISCQAPLRHHNIKTLDRR